MMKWELVATTGDGIQLFVRRDLEINTWQTRHDECGWKSSGHETKAGAVVVGAVHECSLLDEMFGSPLKKVESLGKPTAASSVVAKPSK